MRHLGLNLVLALAVLALMLPFQSCSVYKSKDRDNYDKQGPPQVVGSQKPTADAPVTHAAFNLGERVADSCPSPFDQVAELDEHPLRLTHYVDRTETQSTCRLTLVAPAAEDDLHFDCRLLTLAAATRNQDLSIAAAVWQKRGRASLATTLVNEANSLSLIEFFAFAEPSSETVYCQVVLDPAHSRQSDQLKVQKLGLTLAEHLTSLLN